LGPLFDKELRVASRRRRAYTLRCAYVLLLAAFIIMIWALRVDFHRAGAMSRAQMAVAAKEITLSIVWFQFLAAPLVTVILLSTAISDEVYGRTLCVLMTTPLSSRQVVLNKLSGRLVQILLLVATSLPLLALVRVLGGIPWDYLIFSLLVTAATIIFVGSISLFFSALCRQAYVVMIVSIVTIVALFTLGPWLAIALRPGWISRGDALARCVYWNPLLLLQRYTDYVVTPRRWAAVSTTQIVTCCVLLLSVSAALLTGAARLVRSVALRHAMGEHLLLDRLRWRRFEEAPATKNASAARQAVRRVVGPPMIWKEGTSTLTRREKRFSHTLMAVEIMLILLVYLFPTMMFFASYEVLHLACVCGLLGAGALLTITASATVIGRERESQAWPLLLVTPLTDGDILIGKFVGVLRRCGVVWLLLLAYVAGFAWAKCLRPLAIVQVTMIILSALLFLSATGFYFGSRCRRTADAVTANLALAGALWCVLPLLAQAATYGRDANWATGRSLICAAIPFGQASAMVLTTLDGYITRIPWFGFQLDAWGITLLILSSTAAYLLISLLFLWRAVRAFRRRI